MTNLNLRQKQSLFASLIAKLILKAYELGFEVTLGETWRSEFEATRLAVEGKGIIRSLHQDRLAIDLNLFKDGMFLRDTDSHQLLGDYWKSLHPLCRWGGDFSGKRKDGNHYSVAHEGRA